MGYFRAMDVEAACAECRRLFDYRGDGQLIRRVKRARAAVGEVVGSMRRDGYRQTVFLGRHDFVHRLVWLWHHGTLPECIDHINGDRGDNRIENLRPATRLQNNRCRRVVKGAVPFKGVCLINGRYRATIGLHETQRSLGDFHTADAAAAAYDLAAEKLFGEFAMTNRALGRFQAATPPAQEKADA